MGVARFKQAFQRNDPLTMGSAGLTYFIQREEKQQSKLFLNRILDRLGVARSLYGFAELVKPLGIF